MTKLVIDHVLREKLLACSGPVELCDEAGQAFGRFLPLQSIDFDPALDGCPYAAEDLLRMRSESGGRPLSEIWNSLGRA